MNSDTLVKIAFPGLGIETFTVDKVAFSLFGLEVRWYGILITCGIILAYLYACWRGKQEGIGDEDILDLAMFAVIFGIIGARAYYVLMKPEEFDSFLEVINIPGGGLAIYGGIIAGCLTLIIGSKIKKINLLRLLDCAGPGVMVAQALGRWGNFFNGEAYGAETEIFCRMGLQHYNWMSMHYYHPTFLYESLWNLLGFALINLVYRKKKFDGQIVLMYFGWYGFGRMFIEGLRTDSLYLGQFRVSQLVAGISFVACTALLIAGFCHAHRRKLAGGDYTAVYAKVTETAADVQKQEEERPAKESSENQATETKENQTNGKAD
ncbi:MAG: prolipoprotein diacylglyceryl transferase [Clostridia bacterium]|nr:prolipoprotein diacylglyceryl transferase [Clostridia bacterium]